MAHENEADDLFLDFFAEAPVRKLEAGETLIHAGSDADQVFNIIDGTMMVTRVGKDGRRQVMSFLFRDNFVGLTATENYFFTVQAVTPSRVSCRPRAYLESRLEQNPAAERAFLNMVFRVLENALDLVYSLGQRTAVERLAVFLIYMRHRQILSLGLKDTPETLLDVALPMTRQDIADFLGLKKETVSRSFTQLEEKGLIQRLSPTEARVTELAGLREMAGISDFATPFRLSRVRTDVPA